MEQNNYMKTTLRTLLSSVYHFMQLKFENKGACSVTMQLKFEKKGACSVAMYPIACFRCDLFQSKIWQSKPKPLN